MSTITRYDHPSALDAAGMFVLRAESDLWAAVMQNTLGDRDLAERAELRFARGMHPRYVRHVRLVATDEGPPGTEDDVLGVATLEFPMTHHPHLATLAVVVKEDRRGEGIGSALHSAALDVAEANGRSTLQAWTYEPAEKPDGSDVLDAETGSGSLRIDSPESRFLSAREYVLGQVEGISRLDVPGVVEAERRRDEVLDRKPKDYEVITLGKDIPARLFSGVAALCAATGSTEPSGVLHLEDEAWDDERMRAQMESMAMGGQDQILTLMRHIPTRALVAFTRICRDGSNPEVAHQWETLVLQDHLGRGLGMLMREVNLSAVAEIWTDTRRLITRTACQNSHVLAIDEALGFEPYAVSGFWELHPRGSHS